jgi:hypothetical protein
MGRIVQESGNRSPIIKSIQTVNGGASPQIISEVNLDRTIVMNNPRSRERGSVYLSSSTALARYGDTSFFHTQIIEYY